jgi:hypothetical protein
MLDVCAYALASGISSISVRLGMAFTALEVVCKSILMLASYPPENSPYQVCQPARVVMCCPHTSPNVKVVCH